LLDNEKSRNDTKKRKNGAIVNTKHKILSRIAAPLIVAICVYALFRPQPPFEKLLPWSTPLIDVGFLPNTIYYLVIYVAPDALWSFAFFGALNMQIEKIALSTVIVMSVVVIFECCQYTNIISGTGDFNDVLISLSAVAIYITLFERREKNEKKS
jgi:hypothetical protein